MKSIPASPEETLNGRSNLMYTPWDLSLASVIILSALGILITEKPVHACLYFLLTLLGLATLYFRLEAPFIAAMQVLIYAGAILVIFMFVVVLFQDAHVAIDKTPAKTNQTIAGLIAGVFTAIMIFFFSLQPMERKPLAADFSTVESLGTALYSDFFFPFEVAGLLFLVAMIGAVYIGKKV
jgi:NADH-quinone oxidoreductase subunit J